MRATACLRAPSVVRVKVTLPSNTCASGPLEAPQDAKSRLAASAAAPTTAWRMSGVSTLGQQNIGYASTVIAIVTGDFRFGVASRGSIAVPRTAGIGARPSLPNASAKVASSRNSGRSAWIEGPSLHAPFRPLTCSVCRISARMWIILIIS